MTLATTAGPQLTAALKPQLEILVDDIRSRVRSNDLESGRWQTEYRRAVKERSTAVSWTEWSEDRFTQAAVGWLLASVFIRFCEDNLMLGEFAVWIAGPNRTLRQRAEDAENDFYRQNQDASYREWLESAFAALANCRATRGLVDDHAAFRITSPSSDAIQQLIAFWRKTDDAQELVWTFKDESLSTRFLGDLYQELSQYAKDKFALLQTPEFIEEFILDQTLEPALRDRPLKDFKIIDPACGSGHFLLGALYRLTKRWDAEAPATEKRTRVNYALESVFGVDVNPFAVAIARFRLIVAAVHLCGETSLVSTPNFTLNLAVGDSLLHGPDRDGADAFDYGNKSFDKDAVTTGSSYIVEDPHKLRKILRQGQYDAVVGNPPYITVKDKALNARYREIYGHCKGKYALTIPFMERFFQLAKSGIRPGWIGQITSNSFMKRGFGDLLVENYLTKFDLRLVIDTSGVYIPGHGTPTAILISRNAPRSRETIRAIRGVRGESGKIADPSSGQVWQSIRTNYMRETYSDQWISVSTMPRRHFDSHPWTLSANAFELLEEIRSKSAESISVYARRIGFFGIPGGNEVMVLPTGTFGRLGVEETAFKPLSSGDDVRNYVVRSAEEAWLPYDNNHELLDIATMPGALRFLWRYRAELENRATFGGSTYLDDKRPWYQWHQLPKEDSAHTLTFAEQSTHNHFALIPGQQVLTQKAPVIRIANASGSERLYHQMLELLNTSLACFWLRQNSYCKDGLGEAWLQRYEFSGKTVGLLPTILPGSADRGKRMSALADTLALSESAPIDTKVPTNADSKHDDRLRYKLARAKLIYEQEEADWETYYRYGLCTELLTSPELPHEGIEPGQRAFALELAASVLQGDVTTNWFQRNEIEPSYEIPSHWPHGYRDVVAKRLREVRDNPRIQLLEMPEYKRRWSGAVRFNEKEQFKEAIFHALEARTLWYTDQGTPRPRSIGELAGALEKDPAFLRIVDGWAERKDAPVVDILTDLVAEESVPFLAAFIFKEPGLRKHAEWESIWSEQRKRDNGTVFQSSLAAPPKYAKSDFLNEVFWALRGKLDVQKERFISYPGIGKQTDNTLLLGWAGWDYAERGIALATIYAMRESEGVKLSDLTSAAAGLAEILPWVRQWHSGVDPALGLDLSEYLDGRLSEMSAAVNVPLEDLSKWRPVKTTRARKATARKAVQQ
ncbi:DNA methylase [Rhodococcus sp. 06-1477-1B]|uniref:BREX-2 system adenine-specific DNA-methyltransferase PglX n=1 Tax=Rhodococcus sp. 06-1474-1B TaxID=2022499 RepID=UPI000B9AA1A5|nr:BREX-2 system adenine-specific DNA-methyltransferase PglX [Rhodococcus sp. 06-1474-1B]OZD41666.1 DNA methylase [Rhodococcus sp. 06-1477-1B]OZD54962.1 DNA methylase [Rhodococcus sp. 06-1474-1B]